MGFVKCSAYLVSVGIVSFLLGRVFPKHWFHEDGFLYRSRSFEKEGRIYKKIYIQKWQNKVIDMSRIFPNLMPAKKIDKNPAEKLPVMTQETCIAEFVHAILCIAGFYCIRIWDGWGWPMAMVFVMGNIPFILIQRYNRPRLIHLKKRMEGGCS